MTKVSILTTTMLYATAAAAQPAAAGKRQYQARCVGLPRRGRDGRRSRSEHRGRPAAARHHAGRRSAILILNGIPGRGMPAFRDAGERGGCDRGSCDDLQARPGTAPAQRPRGDAAAGERFFSGQGELRRSAIWCAAAAAFSGPDLSNVGRDRTPAQIEQALRDPGGAPAGQRDAEDGRPRAPSYRAVTVRLRDGQTLRGIAKNESAFDLQLLALDGKLHLLSKDQIAEIAREKSLMPKVDATSPRKCATWSPTSAA